MTSGWTPEALRESVSRLTAPARACAVLRSTAEVHEVAAALAAEAVTAGRSVGALGDAAFIAEVTKAAPDCRCSAIERPWDGPDDVAAAITACGTGLDATVPILLIEAVSAFGSLAQSPRVLSIQSAMDGQLPEAGVVAVLLYDASCFDADAVADAILCTPWLLMADIPCENAMFVSPDEMTSAEGAPLLVERILSGLHDAEENRRAAEERLQQYRVLVDDSPDAIFVHSGGGLVFVNRAAARMVGAASPEDVLGRPVMSFVHPDSLPTVAGRIKMMSEQKVKAPRMLERFVRLDGSAFYAEAIATPLVFEGKPGIQVIMREQTESLATEEELEFKSFLLDNAGDGIIVRDADDLCVLYVNEAMCVLVGRPREQFFSTPELWWVTAEEREGYRRHLLGSLHSGGGVIETIAESDTGEQIPVEVRTSAIAYHGRKALLSVVRNISERRLAQEAIEHMELHDPLTGLANRALLQDRIEVAVAHAKRSGEPLGLIVLDIDHFKSVNDTAGHGTGDLLLLAVAERLHDVIRADDTLARLAGDEFVLVLPEVRSEEDAGILAEKVLDTFREPFMTSAGEISMTASLGISLHYGDDTPSDMLLRNADLAMYVAKEQGRNSYRQFEPSMNEAALQRFALKNDLMHAIERDEIALHYQPIVRLADGHVLGAEALCRWRHPVHGPIPPLTFIPLAEETGIISELGTWVLRQACREARQWAEQGHDDLVVSVNLSPRQAADCDLVTQVAAALGESGLDPKQLSLELTESVAMRDAPRLIGAFRDLRDMGVRIAIDDFGTGYSTFDYLKQLPVDVLKVDRTFVSDVCEDEGSKAIAGAIVSLGKALHLEVIAEGVETEAQRRVLVEAACPSAQGFLFAKDMPADEFRAVLADTATLGGGLPA
ncbi:MAG: EAL domain-containing protein [Actinobacteria bacterium]|nr:EAL domain-containing protein [Actinomycetota bacterium]